MQLALTFPDDDRDRRPALRLAYSGSPDGNVYVFHIRQRTGPDMWKIGHTARHPAIRARELAATAVVWWPGGVADERRAHRLFKHCRMSPGAEYFHRAPDIDRWVFDQAVQHATRDQLAVLADIFRTQPGEAAA